MTNANNTTLYTGVTNNLRRRINEHKNNKGSAFTKRYKLTKLVFYESFGDINEAIKAEKKLKAGSRKQKLRLIESVNPNWNDLY